MTCSVLQVPATIGVVALAKQASTCLLTCVSRPQLSRFGDFLVVMVCTVQAVNPMGVCSLGGKPKPCIVLRSIYHNNNKTRYFLGGKSTDHPLGAHTIVRRPSAIKCNKFYEPNAFNFLLPLTQCTLIKGD